MSKSSHRVNVTLDQDLAAYLMQKSRTQKEPLASVVRSLLIRARALETLDERMYVVEQKLKELGK